MKRRIATIAPALLMMLCSQAAISAQNTSPRQPNPVLYFLGQETVSTQGKNYVRYRYDVFNSASYPDTLFAAAPTLPSCGANTNASRTWVDLYDQRGNRLNGFCALGKARDLNGIWFAVEEGTVPPSWIYIEFTDRQTGTKYKSNLAETTL